MRHSRFLFLATVALSTLHAADWIRISSANFDLYTTYLENDARQTLESFEQTREFFLRVKAFAVTSQLPLRLVGFRNERDYRPYRAGPFIPAYFAGDEEEDYIVMSDLEAERKRVAVHEYVHVLVRHSGLSLPAWLNEGLAEVYSGMQVRNGKVLLGEIPRDRAFALANSNWMHLNALFAIGHGSPEFNEQNRIGLFYAQSCVLAHMLMLGDGYADKFSAFVERISTSGSTQDALKEIYGKSLAAVERDMNTYFRQPTIGGTVYSAALSKVETGPVRAVSDVEIGLTLAKILAAIGRPADAMKQLQQLSATYKDNPSIEEALACLEWRKGDLDTALAHLQSIFGRGGAGWKAYWDYARVLDSKGGDRAAVLDALRKALESNPDLSEARLMLGIRLYETGQAAEALAELKLVKSVAPEHAAAMYLTMAQAALRLEQPLEARGYAEEARKRARKPEEATRADGILQASENAAVPATDMRPKSDADDDPERPILRRRPKKPGQQE